MPPRTIDNLGIDVSTRYAEDQRELDTKLIQESRTVPSQAEIDVSAPFFPSEVESLLQMQPTQVAWAHFLPPLMYFEQKKRLFTHQIIPSMGSDEKREALSQKILSKLRSLAEKRASREKEQKDKRRQYDEEREQEEEEKEEKILSSLLNIINLYDKLIVEINSRRSQYHKG